MTATYAQRKALGDRGEQLATDFLRTHGLHILDRNWRCAAGELDIVAADGSVLVAGEVKTRTSRRFGTPLEAVTPDKLARLHRLVRQWAAEHRARYSAVRVDIVCVLIRDSAPVHIEHIIGAA
jgi:putative endonuclease